MGVRVVDASMRIHARLKEDKFAMGQEMIDGDPGGFAYKKQ
jgi:hypothetical protein